MLVDCNTVLCHVGVIAKYFTPVNSTSHTAAPRRDDFGFENVDTQKAGAMIKNFV